MIKNYFYILFFFAFSFSGFISEFQAESVARNLFKERNALSQQGDFSVKSVEAVTNNNVIVLYVFHLSPNGFVIVSGDDKAHPILGYSFKNNFSTSAMPENLLYLFNLFKEEIYLASIAPTGQNSEIKQLWQKYLSGENLSFGSRNIEPMIEAEFNQGGSWNNVVTQNIGANVPVGCVAVAMCQIMHYWSHPAQGSGSNYYYHLDYGLIEADFSSATYDFDTMPASYANSDSQLLLFHAGVAVNMDYNYSGSGAYVIGDYPSAGHAMKTYFGFSENLNFIHKNNYETNAEFRDLLKQQLEDGKPIMYRGDTGESGHAWNIDGYNGNMLHCNWGWGGSSNGYFNLNSMGGFPNSNAAVVDLFPDFGVPIALFEYDVSGLDVVFLDLSEFASPTQINQWHWSLGDGNSVSSDQAFAQHSYAEGGEYVVSLVVKDIYGQLSEPFTEIVLIEAGDAPVVGDMNDDSILDILDIVVLVNLVIDNPGFDSQGDINNDGILNVLDVILLVNLLLE